MRAFGRAARPRRGLSRAAIAVTAAAVALILAGCGSSSSTSKPAVPKHFFGVDPGVAPDAQDFKQMAETGVETVRMGLSWSAVQPQPGPYNWRLPDAVVSGLAANGIEFLPVLASTPGWVATPPTTPPLASSQDKEGWTQFLKAAVARYGPGGSFWESAGDGGPSPFHALCHCDAQPMPITSWQVWNEPSLTHYFIASSPVESYAELLQISHDAITSVDPQAQIVLAGVPGFAKKGGLNAWKFLDELVHIPGAGSDFDVVALHPYSRNINQLEFEIKKMRAVMEKNGDAAMPLWITELGWGSNPPDRFGFNKGVEGQKQLLTQAYSLLLREHTAWRLDRVYWFEWRDPPPSAEVGCSFCTSAGLLRNDRQPKPAYEAFKNFTRGADN
jgi:GH35 family endo-1,4-beta-xylanase